MLRQQTQIAAALSDLWNAVDVNGNGMVDKDEYLTVCKLIYRVMVDDWDEADTARCAEADWARDSKGQPEMDRVLFEDALFEARRQDTLEPVSALASGRERGLTLTLTL